MDVIFKTAGVNTNAMLSNTFTIKFALETRSNTNSNNKSIQNQSKHTQKPQRTLTTNTKKIQSN